MATLAALGILESPFGGYTDASGNPLNPTDQTLQRFVYNDGRPYTPATQATGTLQQLIEASRNVNYGGNGDAATVVNPLTGQVERADIGFTAPGLDAQSAGGTFFVPQSVAEQWRAGGAPTDVGQVAGGLQSGPWINHSNESNFLDDYGPLLMAGGFGAGHLLTGGAFGGLGAEAAAGGSFLDSLPGMTQAAAPIVEGGAGAESFLGSGAAAPSWLTGAAETNPLGPLGGNALGAAGAVPFSAGDPLGGIAGLGGSALPWMPAAGAAAGLGPIAGAAGAGAAGTAAGTAAASTLAQKAAQTFGGEPWMYDAAGRAIPGLIGAYASNQQADALRGIYDSARADRAPFLAKANEWLTGGPEAFGAGPGMGSLNATLRALSATHGNPIGSPTALGIATDAGLRNWQNSLTGMANLGLGGEDTRAQLATNAVGADSNVFNALGAAAGNIFNPPSTLEQLLKQMKGAGLGFGSLT